MGSLYRDPWLKILFINKKVFLEGYVTGGGYHEFIHDRYSEFEEKISDIFYGWGLHQMNIVQNRFPIKVPKDRNFSNVAWLGAFKPNNLTEFYCKGISNLFMDSESNRNLFISLTDSISNICWIMHPACPEINILFPKSILYENLRTEEKYSSLFILDFPGHTFMYKAIYQCIPFVLYFNRDWRVYFTSSYLIFLDSMEGLGLLYWWDQQQEFSQFLQGMSENRKITASQFMKARKYLETEPLISISENRRISLVFKRSL